MKNNINILGKKRFLEMYQTLLGLERAFIDNPMNSNQVNIHIARVHTLIEQLMEDTFRENDQRLKPYYAMLELRARNLLEELRKKLGNSN
jgi:hypothetical protein